MNEQRRRKIPTIHDVARHANVAVGTVSRVINNSPGVKPATRQRVLAAVRELDYSPNLIARSMTSKQTGSIGVMVPYFTRPFFSEVLQAVERMITQTGREFVLYNVQGQEQREAYFRQLPRQRKVDGLLVVSIYPDDSAAQGFRDANLPVVLIDAYHPRLTSLVVDNVEGAYLAVKCLLEYGHRHIGFINGIDEGEIRFSRAQERLIGLRKAFGVAGLPVDPELILADEWDRQGGRRAALQLLTRKERPTAIFAASDMHAIGVLEAARELDIAIPSELSVMGYDGIELSEILELSTVQQPMKYMGEQGVEKLLSQIEDGAESSPPAEMICLQPQLVMRRTVASPSSAV